MSDDPVRHGKTESHIGSQETLPCGDSDAMAQGPTTEGGNRETRTCSATGFVRIHQRFASRMENKAHDIKLGPGPAETYRSKKDIQALQEFAAKLSPLTQLVKAIYSIFLPDEFTK